MQYTIRGIPVAVDNALRERARLAGKSLNEAAVDALAEGSGMAGSRRKRRDSRISRRPEGRTGGRKRAADQTADEDPGGEMALRHQSLRRSLQGRRRDGGAL
jgi:hypothetical protein